MTATVLPVGDVGQSTGVVGWWRNGGAVAESGGYDRVDMKWKQKAEKDCFEQGVGRELELMIMTKTNL